MPNIRRPRILLVTRNLPPLVGGMERLNWHMAEELAKYADVRLIGPEGSAAMAPTGVPVDQVPLKPLWKFLLLLQWRAWRVARTWFPDVVLAGSGLSAPAAWFAARMSGARAAAYVHGLDLAVRHPVYRAMWWPALRRMDRVIANSRATAVLAQSLGVQPELIGIVPPGVDLPAVPAATDVACGTTGGQATADFCDRNQLRHRPLLLSVGRLSSRKGLREFVTLALPEIVAAHPDALLLVVGGAPKDALHAQAQTAESIRVAAERVGVARHVRFLGTITDGELGEIYRAADVHVFPVRELAGDPEGFGMVAVEAAAHGLPTVAFATGGVADAVADGQSGLLVAPGDYPAFALAVRDTLIQREALREPCEMFATRFAWPEFGVGVREALFQAH